MSATAAPSSPHVMNTYGRLPIALSHGQGCRVWDTNGRAYLDGLGGIAVNTLGHNHPELVPALQDQIAKLIHSSNYYYVPGQEQLAAKLTELSGLTNAFFCCTGLEANEAALKLARKFGHDKGIERPEIVVYESRLPRPQHRHAVGHRQSEGAERLRPAGRGLHPRAAQRHRCAQEGHRRQPERGGRVLRDHPGRRRHQSRCAGNTCSRCASCATSATGCMMIDEVQCGMGRTGKWFAHQWAGIKPDVMPLAKGLGSGVPIGAVVAGPRAAHIFGPGNHGTTFGGNPLAMRAGIETIRIMEEQKLLDNAANVGAHLKAALERELGGLPGVKEIRGQGLMLGIELDRPCGVHPQPRLRRRPAAQRDRRQRDPPGAAADPQHRRSGRDRRDPGAAGEGLPRGASAMTDGRPSGTTCSSRISLPTNTRTCSRARR